MVISTSRDVSALTREIYLDCSIPGCTGGRVAIAEISRAFNHTALPGRKHLLPVNHPGDVPTDQMPLDFSHE